MTIKKDFIYTTIIVLMTIFIPIVPLGGKVEHDSIFRLTGNGHMRLTDVETNEEISVTYRDTEGRYDQKALKNIDHLLRCHGAGEKEVPISLKLIEFVDYVQDSFGAEVVNVTSGYRTPDYNKQLKRRLRRAAKDSLHMHGMAMDIMLSGISKATLGRFMREKEFGGVGMYRRSRFVHVDSGPVRNW